MAILVFAALRIACAAGAAETAAPTRTSTATRTPIPQPPTPTGLPEGAACAVHFQCESKVCSDGHCCNEACGRDDTGSNSYCAFPGFEGICVVATVPPTFTHTPTLTPMPIPTPTRLPLGGACSAAAQCTSGFCSSGRCCESACDHPGQSCRVPGALGACVAFTVGPSHTATPLRSPSPTSPPTNSRTRTFTSTVTRTPTSASTPQNTRTPTETVTPIPRLAAPLAAAATSLLVDYPDALPASGAVRIDDEVMTYASKAGGQLLGLARGLAGTVAAAHAQGAPVLLVQTSTYLLVDSEAGDIIGGGQRALFTPDDGVFVAERNFQSGVSIGFAGAFFLDFASGNHAPLVPGSYEGAVRYPFNLHGEPGLDVTARGRGCNVLSGRFDVLEAEYDGDGDPLAFAADFEQHCENAVPALFGEIRFHSTLPTPTPHIPRTLRVPAEFGTLQLALAEANDGDRVLVAPGTYTGPFVLPGARILIESEAGPEATILTAAASEAVVSIERGEGRGLQVSGFTIQGGRLGVGVSNSGPVGPVLSGNLIRDNGTGIDSEFASTLIVDNVVENNRDDGIFVGSTSLAEIRRNRIRHNGQGIGLAGNAQITDNEISDNTSHGVGIISGMPLVAQNLIVRNGLSGVSFLVASGQPGPVLLNNTIADNRRVQGSAILADGFYLDVEITNNLLIGAPGTTAVWCANNFGGSTPKLRANDAFSPAGSAVNANCSGIAGANGNISADPLFRDAAQADYRLAAGSPGIDIAAAGYPDIDIDGAPRPLDGNGDGIPNGDLGAYEFEPPKPTRTRTGTPAPTHTAPPSSTPTSTPTLRPAGSQCTTGTQCISSSCFDGICCDRLCRGAGEFCSLAGYEGSCLVATLPPTRTATATRPPTPTVTTGPLALGDPCGDADECTSGFCRNGVCCESACDAPTAFCALPRLAGLCASFDAPPTRTPTRTPTPRPGDGNCDGRNSAADVVDVIIASSSTAPPRCGRDVDGNGHVDAGDVAAVLPTLFDPLSSP